MDPSFGQPSRPPASPATAGTSGRPHATTLADLDADSLSHCAGFLTPRDISSLAMTCRRLHRAAASDSVWSRLFRDRWPWLPLEPGIPGARDVFYARHAALQQFKFVDPMEMYCSTSTASTQRTSIILKNDDIIVAQGPNLQISKVDASSVQLTEPKMLRGHNARITCIRSFPHGDTFIYRSETHGQDFTLVTSSADHTIRLWWKGRSQRCYKGHNGPVTTLADKLLGDSKVLASGGEDGTVRLWSFSASGKRQPLNATLHGHEKPISSLSVAEHNSSLLLSSSTDGKIRVWDVSAVSCSPSSSCVGMARVLGQTVEMKCHDAICYIGSTYSVTAIDIRSMQNIFTVDTYPKRLNCFSLLPSKALICTGFVDKAMLWDIREYKEVNPVADLDEGCVQFVHMDTYKIVTGAYHHGPINIWETNTGTLVNSLDCYSLDDTEEFILSGLAVEGYRIVTTYHNGTLGVAQLRDFSNCSIPKSSEESWSSSKFWELRSSSTDE